jgi:hypothetical protein
MSLATGTYSVTAAMTSYLDSVRDSVDLSTGQTLNLPPVQLRGGDVNDDCTVNILDLSRMGSRFGSGCGDPDWDLPSDINGDCTLNILDLSIAGGNFNRTCPTPWTAIQAAAASARSSAQVQMEPSPLNLVPESTGVMTITVTGATGLYGAEAHLSFDPDVVEVVDADVEKEGVQVALGDLLSPDFVALNQADNAAGTIDVALIQLAPTPPSDGDGALAAITFRMVGTGTTPITFTDVILADPDGGRISAEVSGGTVRGEDVGMESLYLPLVVKVGIP